MNIVKVFSGGATRRYPSLKTFFLKTILFLFEEEEASSPQLTPYIHWSPLALKILNDSTTFSFLHFLKSIDPNFEKCKEMNSSIGSGQIEEWFDLFFKCNIVKTSSNHCLERKMHDWLKPFHTVLINVQFSVHMSLHLNKTKTTDAGLKCFKNSSQS